MHIYQGVNRRQRRCMHTRISFHSQQAACKGSTTSRQGPERPVSTPFTSRQQTMTITAIPSQRASQASACHSHLRVTRLTDLLACPNHPPVRDTPLSELLAYPSYSPVRVTLACPSHSRLSESLGLRGLNMWRRTRSCARVRLYVV